jgi:hypothetical protein
MNFKSKKTQSILLNQRNEAFKIKSDDYMSSNQSINLGSIVDRVSEIQDLFWLKNLNQTAGELKKLKKGWFSKK